MSQQAADIDAFIRDACAVRILPCPDADLFDALSLYGDDCDEFLDVFSQRFAVDMTGYLWYFHHAEEGQNFGSLFFKPPDQRVKHIPVTIELLRQAVATGRWPVDYPAHTLPAWRWDMVITCAAFGFPIVLLLIAGLRIALKALSTIL